MTVQGAKRPMRICLLSQEYPPHTHWGGIGVYTDVLARMLAIRGHEVAVVARLEDDAPEYERIAPGHHVWRVGAPPARKRFIGRTPDRMLHARAVRNAVRRLDEKRRFDVIEAPESSLDAAHIARDANLVGRLLVHCHGSNAWGQPVSGWTGWLHRLDWAWSFRLEQAMLARAPQVVTPSAASRDFVVAHGVDGAKVRVVHHGVDTTQFAPASSLVRRDGRVHVGFVGRLESRKGLDHVWQVVARMNGPRFHFHFLGSIHPSTRAETLARFVEFADRTTYHAPVPHDRMAEFYRGLDVLLLPSRFESFGLAYVEAMASGLVVLAGSRGGGAEIVADGRTGYLIDANASADRTASVLVRLAAEPSLRQAIGDAARSEVLRRFSLEACVAATLDVYREMVHRRRGATRPATEGARR